MVQITPRGDQHAPTTLWQPRVPDDLQCRECQTTTSRITHDHDMLGLHRFMLRLRGRANKIQVRSEGILDRARERILWAEAIIDGWED